MRRFALLVIAFLCVLQLGFAGLSGVPPACTSYYDDGVVPAELADCTSFTQDVTIRGSFTNLDAFAKLQAARKFEISSNNVMQVAFLPKLATLSGTLHVQTSSSLKNVTLPSLTSVGAFFTSASLVSTWHLPALTTIEGAFTLQSNTGLNSFVAPALIVIRGKLMIADSSLPAGVSFPMLTSIGGLDYQRNLAPSLTFSAVQDIYGEFRVLFNTPLVALNFPALRVVNQFLVQQNDVVATLSFPALTTVNVSFTIQSNPKVTSLVLPSLATAKQLTLPSNNALVNFSFPALVSVEQSLSAGSNELMGIDLPVLKSVGGEFKIQPAKAPSLLVPHLKSLGSLALAYTKFNVISLPALTTVTDALTLWYQTQPGAVNVSMPALSYVGGLFKLQLNVANLMIDLRALNYTGAFEISSQDSLVEFRAPRLSIVGGTFSIYGNSALRLLELPSLSRILGNFDTDGNSQLVRYVMPSLVSVRNFGLWHYQPTVGFESLTSALTVGTLRIPNACCAHGRALLTRVSSSPKTEPDSCDNVMTCPLRCTPSLLIPNGRLPASYNDTYGADPQSAACLRGYGIVGAARTCTVAGTWSGSAQSCQLLVCTNTQYIGENSCEDCPANTTSINGATSSAQCCSAEAPWAAASSSCVCGLAGKETKGAFCSNCTAGTYRTNVATNAPCQRCPPNTYAPAPGHATACLPCPYNTFAGIEGLSSAACFCNSTGTWIVVDPAQNKTCYPPVTCAANQYAVEGSCVSCPAGTTSASGSTAVEQCCPAFSRWLKSVGNCVCEAGYESANPTADCTLCTPGKYRKNDTNTMPCLQCPTNTYSGLPGLGTVNCSCNATGTWVTVDPALNGTCEPITSCAANQYMSGQLCVSCPAGTTSQAGSTSASQCCPARAQWTAGTGCNCALGYQMVSGACAECPAGKYRSSLTTINCTTCPSDTYSPQPARSTPCLSCPNNTVSRDPLGFTTCYCLATGVPVPFVADEVCNPPSWPSAANGVFPAVWLVLFVLLLSTLTLARQSL